MATEQSPRSGAYLVRLGHCVNAGLWDGGRWSTVDRFQEVLPLTADGYATPVTEWSYPPATRDELLGLIEAGGETDRDLSRPRRAAGAPRVSEGNGRANAATGNPHGWHTMDTTPPHSGVYVTRQGEYVLAALWDRGRWHDIGRGHATDALGHMSQWAPLSASAADLQALLALTMTPH